MSLKSQSTIGVDLLQNCYQIFSKKSELGNQEKYKQLPSALLPLYSGEKGIFGFEALDHRRAKGWKQPKECSMYWNNDVESGCGRVVVATAMQRLVNYHYSWGNHKSGSVDSFSWQPSHTKQILSSAEIIVGTIQMIASGTKQNLSLALPDNSTQSAQQAILNSFYSKNNQSSCSGSTLHLIKRSIAQAMLWCDKFQNDLSDNFEPYDGQHVGHLLVINAGIDCWEVRFVPLQWYLWEDEFYLVPVESEYLPRESLQVSGLQLAVHRLSQQGIKGEMAWQALLGQELLYDLFSNQPMTAKEWEQLRHIIPGDLPHTEEFFVQTIPALSEIESKLDKLMNRRQQLSIEGSSILGVIIDGCCTQWFKNLNLLDRLNKVSQNDFVTFARSDEPSIAAKGAEFFAACHSNETPSYLVELMPISIWCRNSVRYGQEYIWKPLISKNTIPAGCSSQLESCPGFVLPAGQSELQLILRRPSVDSEQEYEYRKIPVKIYEKFNTNINVTIAVEIKPGSGHAKARLLSDDGHSLSELDWKAMSVCEKPNEHQPSYLARTCEALCEANWWNAIARQLAKLKLGDKQKKRRDIYLLQDSLEVIHELLNKCKVKADKGNGFQEWRVISSDGKVDDHATELEILAEFLEVCYLESVRQEEGNIKKKTLQAMRHLFTAVTKNTREFFLKRLEEKETLTMQELLCIGQSFRDETEITTFLQAFLATIQLDIRGCFYWLRALRSILRYRYEVFDPEIVDDIFYQKIWDSIVEKLNTYESHPKILRSAIQCLIYLLGRRRFNRHFVEPSSQKTTELNLALKKLDVKKSTRELLDQFEKLLNCTAAEGDIQLLLSSEVTNDED